MAEPTEPMPESEEWRDVPGYDGGYQVSNLGRVRSIERITFDRHGREVPVPGRMLQQVIPPTTGQPEVSLSRRRASVNWRVRRLVALAFLGDPPHERAYVANVSGDRLDNRACNLEWRLKRREREALGIGK